jgi:hypothetical protein
MKVYAITVHFRSLRSLAAADVRLYQFPQVLEQTGGCIWASLPVYCLPAG